MVQVSSPRRFYECRQITQFQCHKYQVATYPPQNYSCEALQSRIKINVSKVSRGPLRSSGGRQIKTCFYCMSDLSVKDGRNFKPDDT